MKKHTVKYALVTLFALAVLTATTIFLPRPVHGQAGVGPQGKNYQDFRQSYVDFGNGLVINNGVVLGGNVIGQLHTTVSLTAAQIIGMSAAPVQLIAAPGT